MRDETESISVFRSSYTSVLATSTEKLYSTFDFDIHAMQGNACIGGGVCVWGGGGGVC